MKTLQRDPTFTARPAAGVFRDTAALHEPIMYMSTNGTRSVSFRQAFMDGLAPDYGLYMPTRMPKLPAATIRAMGRMGYAEIATAVLMPYLEAEIPPQAVERLLHQAYDQAKITVDMQHLFGNTHLMWLTGGPTYSFKDYAARFYGVMLSHFLTEADRRKIVIAATSGDTGGAVADALHNKENVDVVVLIPEGRITGGQRRQMSTLKGNVHVLELKLQFSGCQELAKLLLSDRDFAREAFGDPDIFTSANSISIARLLPQAVYPFYAHSRVAGAEERMAAVIPSGNFGDMMGTVIAGRMGLPLSQVICALNGNDIFARFLQTGRYMVTDTVDTPASAMDVDHPSNVARLVQLYGGHMFDRRAGGRVVEKGAIDRMPDLDAMRRDIRAFSASTEGIYAAMADAHDQYNVVLDPHGAVGYWAAMRHYEACPDATGVRTVIYETADPGKFPGPVAKATGMTPPLPKRMHEQASMDERIYRIGAAPDTGLDGSRKLSPAQVEEARQIMRELPIGR